MDIPIYIINLKHRKKRLFSTLNELQKLDLFNNIIIHKATTKEQAEKERFKYITQKANDNIEKKLTSLNIIPSWGAVACAISHFDCWKDIKEKCYQYAIICEDDIKIDNVDKLKYSLYKCLQLLKQNKPYFITLNSLTNAGPIYDENINYINGHFTNTSFYMINYNAVDELLKILPLTYQFDLEIGLKKDKHKCTLLNCTHTGVNNYIYPSDIQYYFITENELSNTFQQVNNFLPPELVKKIFFFLPKRNELSSKLTHYLYGYEYNINHLYGYNYGYDYPISYDHQSH